MLMLVRQASVLELVVYAAPGTNQRRPSGFSPLDVVSDSFVILISTRDRDRTGWECVYTVP